MVWDGVERKTGRFNGGEYYDLTFDLGKERKLQGTASNKLTITQKRGSKIYTKLKKRRKMTF